MPQIPHLPPLAAAVVTIMGVVLAITRLLTASKAFWWRFPEWLQKGLPAALVALGTLPAALEAAKSWLDVAVAFVFAVGAWFTASRGDDRPVEQKPPTVPPLGMLVLGALFLGCLLLAGCARLAQVDWSKPAHCADTSEYALVIAVEKVLDGTGDLKTELGAIAETYGPEAVVCAVKQIVGQLGTVQLDAKPGHRAFRGRDFLVQVGQ